MFFKSLSINCLYLLLANCETQCGPFFWIWMYLGKWTTLWWPGVLSVSVVRKYDTTAFYRSGNPLDPCVHSLSGHVIDLHKRHGKDQHHNHHRFRVKFRTRVEVMDPKTFRNVSSVNLIEVQRYGLVKSIQVLHTYSVSQSLPSYVYLCMNRHPKTTRIYDYIPVFHHFYAVNLR